MIIQRCPVEDTLKGVHDLVESGKKKQGCIALLHYAFD